MPRPKQPISILNKLQNTVYSSNKLQQELSYNSECVEYVEKVNVESM